MSALYMRLWRIWQGHYRQAVLHWP